MPLHGAHIRGGERKRVLVGDVCEAARIFAAIGRWKPFGGKGIRLFLVELTAGGYEIEGIVAKAHFSLAVPLGSAHVIGCGEGKDVVDLNGRGGRNGGATIRVIDCPTAGVAIVEGIAGLAFQNDLAGAAGSVGLPDAEIITVVTGGFGPRGESGDIKTWKRPRIPCADENGDA